MKTAAIVPARWGVNAEGLPFSPQYEDIYHPQSGALVQARHVFLAGNGLPERWQGRDRFVVLETGFGLGNNFLATWDLWRRDPQRCRHLHFISVERHPLTRADLAQVHQASALRDLADALTAAWPPLTPNLHRLSFDDGQVQLLLALGDVAAWLPELVAQGDAFFLDGFAPARNPAMWQPRLFKAMARLAAPGATAATWTAAQAVRAGLQSAGFEVQLAAGTGGKRDITLARFAPRFEARRAVARRSSASGYQHALIVGAGLAGCAAAWALAEQGWTSTVIDRHATPAQEASGSPGGLFHGIVNPQDGAHARFNRAAALQAQRVVRNAIAEHGVAGQAEGMLRLEPSMRDAAAMHSQLAQLGLPGDYVQALSATQASALCGMPLRHPAWFYPGGGWIDPGALAQALLARAGARASYRGGVEVQALRRCTGGWELADARGHVIGACETVVLANAFDALRLLGSPAWRVEKIRGQISLWQPDAAARTGLALPRMPISGAGYLLPLAGSQLVFGATSAAGDADPSVRPSDHVQNLSQLNRLTDGMFAHLQTQDLEGRTAWRMVSSDRLPIVGAVPDMAALNTASTRRLDQPRFVPRLPGLFVFTALGSRGITWSALGAQVLASCVSGAPQPLESSLLDAIDPARFVSRAVRRASSKS